MYHIFQVYDYKGGELSSCINLTESQFISELVDRVIYDVEEIDLTLPLNKLKSELLSSIKASTDYAGGDDSVVISCYKSTATGLKPLDYEYFIRTNWQLFIDAIRSYDES